MNESGRWKFEGERKAAQSCMTTTVYRLSDMAEYEGRKTYAIGNPLA